MEGDCGQWNAFQVDDLSRRRVSAAGALLCVEGEEGSGGQEDKELILLNYRKRDDWSHRRGAQKGALFKLPQRRSCISYIPIRFPTFSSGTMMLWDACGRRS